MIKAAVAQQRKQHILNYEIQMIEECPESLFTQDNCQHHRYLGWELGESLQRMLQNYHYTFRWMGNDQNAHIYAYFYIVIIGCASRKSTMFQLKTIMYELSRKYLAQYQQKFLIQFLCLIQYSEDKFHFFRKYQKMEGILLKIFKQIQQRHPLINNSSFRPSSQQQNPNSYVTTGITSPSKSREADHEKSKVLRNSDYYNSSMKKIELQYRAEVARRLQKESNYNNIHFISWYQTYNKIFNFMKMRVISEENVKFEIQIDKKQKLCAQFIVTVQKDCFFVVQMFKIDRSKNNTRKDISQFSRPGSAIEESEQYWNKLLQKEIKESQIKKTNFDFTKPRNKKERLSFTPKFLSNKKKLSWNNSNDLYSGDVNGKNVQIEVLDLSQFKQNTQNNNCYKIGTHQQSNSQSYKQTECKTLEYANKITDLRSIGQTVKSVQKNSIIQEIKSHPDFNLYKTNHKNANIMEFNSFGKVNRRQMKDPNVFEFSSQKYLPNAYAFQNLPSSRENINYHGEAAFRVGYNNRTIDNKQPSLCSISQYASTVRVNHDGRTIVVNNISEVPPNQTFLSAKNLKKRQNLVVDYRKNSLMQDKKLGKMQKKQFHSYSPPQPVIQTKNKILNFRQFYSPSRMTGKSNGESGYCYGPKIKFTYL